MSDPRKVLQLELTPVPPETVSSGKQQVQSLVEAALREAGHENLLADGQIEIQVEKTFPVDQEVIIILVTLGSKIAYDIFRDVGLPRIRRRFGVKERSERQEDEQQDNKG